MKKSGSVFSNLFVLLLLVCVLFIAWYIPSVRSLRSGLEETKSRVVSMQGQVRKQQYEYDQIVAELPEVQAELDRVTPLNDAAETEVKELKAERKKLRKEKKELEAQADSSTVKEDGEHE